MYSYFKSSGGRKNCPCPPGDEWCGYENCYRWGEVEEEDGKVGTEEVGVEEGFGKVEGKSSDVGRSTVGVVDIGIGIGVEGRSGGGKRMMHDGEEKEMGVRDGDSGVVSFYSDFIHFRNCKCPSSFVVKN